MRVNPKLEGFVKKNGATILTYTGVVGVAATAVLTSRATTKANDILKAAREAKDEDLTTKEKIKYTLPVYIPPIVAGVGTVACILGANVINKKHQASLMSAYALLDQSYKEYRNKVAELYGKDAEKAVEEAIKEDHCPRRRSRTSIL